MNEWYRQLRRDLNPQQYLFATEHNSSILGIAGPGSGKTRSLTYRLANLLREGVSPENILLVTFTNKAAGEMKERVKDILGELPPRLWAGTFHSIGARILRRHASLVNRSSNFTILDEDDRNAMIKSSLSELKVDLKPAERSLFIKRSVLGKVLSSARNSALGIESYICTRTPELEDYISLFTVVEKTLENKKMLANAFDFYDLLTAWLKLLQENEHVKNRYQEQFGHTLVDEYQDTNTVQEQLISILGGKGSTCVVGDDAQSIYGFRCAEITNLLNFPVKHPQCTVIKLVENYRSTPQILMLANCSIAHNKEQFPKELYSVREAGEIPLVYRAPGNMQEAGFVADTVEELYSEGIDLREMAVLYRSSYLAQDTEIALMKRGIPYLTFGGLKFLQRAHIKDLLAWLKILENPCDEISWQRVALMCEGVGESTFRETWQKLRSFLHPARAAAQGKVVPRRGAAGWKLLSETMGKLLHADTENVPLLIKLIVDNFYGGYMQKKYPLDYRERSRSLERLAAYGERCSSLRQFLETLLLEETLILEGEREESPEKDFLTLSTIHSAKGKEWKVVFVIGLNQGSFPSMQGLKNMEEERRLFYVAATRAKDFLYLATSEVDYRGWEKHFSGPSQFLKELPEHCYQMCEYIPV